MNLIGTNKNMKLYKSLLVMTLFIGAFKAPVYSINAASGEFSDKSPAEVNTIVLKTLEKIGSKYHVLENTNGFVYRYTNPFMNLFPFDLYIGEYNKGSMVRIESIDNTNHALLDAIKIESYNTKYPYTHSEKSLVLGHILTFVLPAAGNLYTTLDSPFNIKLSWLFSILYLGVDGALLYMGGTSFFTHAFDPFKTGLPTTIALLGTHRLAHMVFNHISIVAHNKMIGLGYTFQFE